MKPINYLIEQTYGRGMENLVAGETAIGKIDGVNGKLWFRGYDIEELAKHSSFDEVSYLVIHGELPTPSQYAGWIKALEDRQDPPLHAMSVVKTLPAAHAMMLFRTMLSVAACQIPEGENVRLDAQWRRPARLLAWCSTLAAAAICHMQGTGANPHNPNKSFAEDFLIRSLCRTPTKDEVKAFDVCLIVQAEHGVNAATLAAITVASTGADLGSAVLAGMSALSGKLQGGANEQSFMNLKQHATAKDARAWVRQKLEEKHRFPGFGHRVYKTKDPRAKVLEPHVKKLLENRGESNLWKIYRAVEEEVESVLGPKGIHGNIDGVSGLLYYALGFPSGSYSIPLALAIQTGWMAHCLEYLSEGKMIEPGAIYTG